MNGDHVLKLNDLHRQYVSCLVEFGSQSVRFHFSPSIYFLFIFH